MKTTHYVLIAAALVAVWYLFMRKPAPDRGNVTVSATTVPKPARGVATRPFALVDLADDTAPASTASVPVATRYVNA